MIHIANSAREQERPNQGSVQLRQPEVGAGGEVYEETGEALFRAGEYVASGTYIEIETGRCVTLTALDYLPARLDGKVAWYRLARRRWEETTQLIVFRKLRGMFGEHRTALQK